MARKLLFIINVDWFFLSHRLPIAEAALRAGYEVHLACGFTGQQHKIEALGVIVHELPIHRRETAPGAEVATLRAMIALLRTIRPDIVHLVTIKPLLFGGLAARIARTRSIVGAISGMGFVFIARGLTARLRRVIVALFYRLALNYRNVTVIVQNPDDARLVGRLTGLRPDRIETIRGSGVDLDAYEATPLAGGETVVIFAARLLIDKGLREFVMAARILKQGGIDARFVVAGDPDPQNPATVDPGELERWRQEGTVEFVGHQPDINGLFAQAHVVVLPSYREGLPKVLLEAAACGRAVITTDVPGCRDAVEEGRTALLVPVMTVEPLASAMKELIEDRDRCAAMGRAGRELAESTFSIEQVVSTHLAIYSRSLERSA